ncbi:MAG TPA: terminase TerL endonuclease subunit [Gaiellaceae bacterium]|nr:terminase TerL endonuclease subunit [Gaiellaceae bacterium]
MGLRGPGAAPKGGALLVSPRRGQSRTWARRDLPRAERVVRFLESLTVTSGARAGEPFRVRPWQREIIEAWYATDASGRRIVRTGLLTLGRKNGKTTLCAALALAHLLGPETEPRGLIVCAAKDRDQASLLYDEVVAFLRRSPKLLDRVNIKRHAKEIEDLATGSRLLPVSSDAGKAHGLSPSVVIIDELAQWGTGAGRELYDALTTGTGARAEPLTLIISTQGDPGAAGGLMAQLVEYGRAVRAGQIHDPAFSPWIFEAPLEADPWDERVWPLANPALGDFRSLEEMREFAARARAIPGLEATFRRYYLNQAVAAETRWLSLEDWDACAAPHLVAEMRGRAWLGLDLASTRDLTALALVIPDGEAYIVRTEFWVPSAALAERERSDRVPYRQWVGEGWLRVTPGNVTDYGFVEQRVRELAHAYDVVEVGVDPWNARDLIVRLQRDGVPVVEVPQTIRMLAPAAKALERAVLQRQIRHDGNPVMRWCVSNTVCDVDANLNLKPSKVRSTGRIDGVSALVTALARVLAGEVGGWRPL